jgi:hypothetical protein
MIQRLVAVAVLAVLLVVPMVVRAQAPGVDPEAEKVLRRSMDYLAGLHQFSADTQNTLGAVLASGQKIEFDATASLIVQRPDKLRAERKGELLNQVFYYDGKTLTLYNPSDNLYATVAAPRTLERMMDFARSSLDIFAPAGDLLYRNAFELLMQDVTSGFVVGKAELGGAVCDHLAFSGKQVDWQIWVEEGDQPLPRKYVITSKLVIGWPQYTVLMDNWNVAPAAPASQFSFVPPAGAKKVDFLPLAGSSASR